MNRSRWAVAASLLLAVGVAVPVVTGRFGPSTSPRDYSIPPTVPTAARTDTEQSEKAKTPPADTVARQEQAQVAPREAPGDLRLNGSTATAPPVPPSPEPSPGYGAKPDIKTAPSPSLADRPEAPTKPAIMQAPAESRASGGRQGAVEIPRSNPAPMAQGTEGSPSTPKIPAPTPNLGRMQDQGSFVDRVAPAEPQGRDRFAGEAENPFRVVREEPVSTFSLDVDTASYSFVRTSLARNALPPKAAVRTEELVNYFPYDYPAPADAREPFRTTVSVFPSPWNEGRRMVHIGIRGYAVQPTERPRANLVFLIDTSGSMSSPNRLPLAKQALAMLVEQLDGRDTVGIVTYAGHAGVALEPTAASQKAKILAAIDALGSGGSTAGAEGIRQAYALAEAHLDPNGVNRVVLATDGDFNVGITSRDELKGFVERKRERGVFLSVLGFGMGNYNDALMQALAQNGNGVAAYIDTLQEARKTLVEEATSTIVPIAKDVKIQIEFNPAQVAEYRLVGYETRALRREDFSNDKVDAGDVGSGHTVTAIYEIVPAGAPRVNPDLRYAPPPAPAAQNSPSQEIGFLSMRYKLPKSDTSELVTTPVSASSAYERFEDAPQEARFAVSVAGFGEILRGGRHTGRLTYDDVIRTALAARGSDPFGYRSEFIQLVRSAKTAAAMQAPR